MRQPERPVISDGRVERSSSILTRSLRALGAGSFGRTSPGTLDRTLHDPPPATLRTQRPRDREQKVIYSRDTRAGAPATPQCSPF